MKLTQIFEAPLPDEWDHSVYNGKNNFKNMIAYATEQAKKLGAGSSRVAFEIPYEGRETVIKIAKNSKGLAQNEAESQLFSDYYIRGTGLVIPIIDYDEVNEPPRWIHTEKAEKITDKDFIKECGVDLATLIQYVEAYFNYKPAGAAVKKKIEDTTGIDLDSELVVDMIDLRGNYDGIEFVDLDRLANWGLYEGRPVIIDLGFTSETKKLYMR